jgi:hypothetical protein
MQIETSESSNLQHTMPLRTISETLERATQRLPLEHLHMNQAEPSAAHPVAAAKLSDELSARLARGEIPQCLRDMLKLVDETSDEGRAFQHYQLDMLQRVFPSWDMTKHPVRILLSADEEANAGFLKDAQPITIIMNKGCFRHSASNTEDLAVLTLGHEITHAKSHLENPKRKNSKAEEMACDLLPIREVFLAGFNPLASRDHFQACVAKTEVDFISSIISSFLVHPTAASRVSGIEAELTRLFLRYGDIERDNTCFTPEHPLTQTIAAAQHESSFSSAVRRWNREDSSLDDRISFMQRFLETQEILTPRLVEDIGRFLIRGVDPTGPCPSQGVIDTAFESIVTWAHLGYLQETKRLFEILSYIERGGAHEGTAEESRHANERCAENLHFLPPAHPMGKFREVAEAVADFQRSTTRAEALRHGELLLRLVRCLPYFSRGDISAENPNQASFLGSKSDFKPPALTEILHSWEWPRYTVVGEVGRDFEIRSTICMAEPHVRLPWEPLCFWSKEGPADERETLRAAAFECGLVVPDLSCPQGKEAWDKIFAGRGSVIGFGVKIVFTKNEVKTPASSHMTLTNSGPRGKKFFIPANSSDALTAMIYSYKEIMGSNVLLTDLLELAMAHTTSHCQECLDSNEAAPSTVGRRKLKQAMHTLEHTRGAFEVLGFFGIHLPIEPEALLPVKASPTMGVADWRAIVIANSHIIRKKGIPHLRLVSKLAELLPIDGTARKDNIERLLLACTGEPDGSTPILIAPHDDTWDNYELGDEFEPRHKYNPILFRIINRLQGKPTAANDLFNWVCDLALEASPGTAQKVLERCIPWSYYFLTPLGSATVHTVPESDRKLIKVFEHISSRDTSYVPLMKASTPGALARAVVDLQTSEAAMGTATRWSAELKQALLFLKTSQMVSRRGIGQSLAADEFLILIRNLPKECFGVHSNTLPHRLELLLRDKASVSLEDRIEAWGITHDSIAGDPVKLYKELKKLMGEVSGLDEPERRTKLYETLLARSKTILEPTLNSELGRGWIDSLVQQYGEDNGSPDYTRIIRGIVARTEYRFNAINRYTFYNELADRISASEGSSEVLNASASRLSSEEITSVCRGTPLIDVIANQARYSDALRVSLLDFMCRSQVSLADCRGLSAKIRSALENRADRTTLDLDLRPTKAERENQAKRLHLLHRFLQTLPEELKLIPIRELVWPATERDFWNGMAVLDKAAELAFPGKDAGAEYARGKLKRYVRQLPDYVQPYVLSAIVSTSARRTGSKPDIGAALSRILNEIGGPAEASVAQKAQGHPATLWEIRTALAHTKTNHAPPTRHDQWLALRSNVPAEWWTRITSNPRLIGSGKLYLAFQVAWRDAETGEVTPYVLSVLRPYAVIRGRSGFKYMNATFQAEDPHPNDRAINMMIQSAEPSLETEADTPRALEMGALARAVYSSYEIQVGERVIKVQPYAIKAAAPGCFVSSYMDGTQLAKLPDTTPKEREERRTAFLASCAMNLTALLSLDRSDHDRHIGNESFSGDTLQMLDLWGVLTPTASGEVKLAITRGIARSIAQSSWFGDGASRYLTEHLVTLAEQNPALADEIGWHQEAILALSDKLSALGWREKVWVFAAALNALGEDYWSVTNTELGATWKGRMVLGFIERFQNPVTVRRRSC